MNDKETTKQRMINATKELICQGKKPSEITVADITEKANVGNGMVNYHFQSKDNLMREAVRDVTVCAKKHLTEILKPFASAPVEQRLAILLKEVLDFFAQNAEIGKIAILDNLENEEGIPHLLSDVTAFGDCLEQLCEDNTCSVWMKNIIVVGFINSIFLKAEIIKKETGFDFYEKQERDTVVDNFVHELIANTRKQ
jgi:AcrR family transcriptional regulator